MTDAASEPEAGSLHLGPGGLAVVVIAIAMRQLPELSFGTNQCLHRISPSTAKIAHHFVEEGYFIFLNAECLADLDKTSLYRKNGFAPLALRLGFASIARLIRPGDAS
ncbi:MAG: hypothetical protein AAGC68_02490 [Verrucomicrobiota bacterium]